MLINIKPNWAKIAHYPDTEFFFENHLLLLSNYWGPINWQHFKNVFRKDHERNVGVVFGPTGPK